MSWAIWITGRPGSGTNTPAVRVAEAVQARPVTLKVLDLAHAGAAVAPDITLDSQHTHATDFRSTVEDVLLLGRRLHRGAATTVTPAERNVP